ncbi:YbaB/EbfC family nucleoid-associated protein [Nocardia higoensis]|uniref:YbaB/EbfC family nucleoid-associated protein n=1 Tax=Nocardia higoensis TaxID=228599 RepID=UPI000304B1F4|nr:YbaB/EbfC family nucleoid-associated protein [Nocardia higoensis]
MVNDNLGGVLPPHLAPYANSPGQLANALMDELVANAQHRLERMRELGDRMSAVRVRQSSADGAVTVTVDGNGAMLDLVLTSAVSRWTPEQFDEAVVGTARLAAAQAFARRGELVSEFNAMLSSKTADSQHDSSNAGEPDAIT